MKTNRYSNYGALALAFVFILSGCVSFPSTDNDEYTYVPPANETYSDSLAGSGTGFFISPDGLLVTCAHVVNNSSRITIRVDGREYPAYVLAKNQTTDLALLKTTYDNPNHFRMISFNDVKLGDEVYTLGFPLGDMLGTRISVTNGIVSALSGINDDMTYFQFSAPIHPGNSGGPALNRSFELMGVVAQTMNSVVVMERTGGVGPQNIGFGVKSGYIDPLLGQNRAGRGNVRNMDGAVKATVQILVYANSRQEAPQNVASQTPGNNQPTLSAVTFVNRTGKSVYYIYLSPVTSDVWGDDLLGDDTLGNNQSATISFSNPINSAVNYDVRMRASDGTNYVKRNVSLSANQRVEFSNADVEGGTAAAGISRIIIVNKTGYPIQEVNISPASSSEWGSNMLNSGQILGNNQRATITFQTPLSAAEKYDIRLRDTDNDSYIKTGVELRTDISIEFVISDIHWGS